MDEYLSEKEQLEHIRQWWADYGWYLIGGVAIGLLALFGYGRYQDTVAASSENAAALYSELTGAVEDDDLVEAERALTTLRSEFADSPYTAHGSMMLATMVLVSDPARAIAALRAVMDDSDDAQLAMIARLRLARVLAWQERYDEALALLDVEEPGAFAARLYDIRGDVLLASGDPDGARAAFTTALIMPGSDALDRNYLQMKLSSLTIAQSGESAATTAAMPEADLDAVATSGSADSPEPAEPDSAAETVPQADPAADSEPTVSEPAAAEPAAAEPVGEGAAP